MRRGPMTQDCQPHDVAGSRFTCAPCMGACPELPFRGLLDQHRDGLHILALIEAGLDDGSIPQVDKAEDLKGTELVVVAQAYLQAVMADVGIRRLALGLQFGRHLVDRHVEEAQKPLSLRGCVFLYEDPDRALARCVDGLGGEP